MAVSVQVPDLGDGMDGGIVAEWYLADGTSVSVGDSLCRIECDFVAFDVEAEEPGLLRHQLPVGSIERPGVVLGLIFSPDESLEMDPDHASDSSVEEIFSEAETVFEDEVPDAFVEPGEPLFEHSAAADDEPEYEAVVVPFPRRFAETSSVAWEGAPGDAVDFESGFFSGKPDMVTGTLIVAGGSIPGLPLWENENERSSMAERDEPRNERFARISAEVAASAQVLAISAGLNLDEARKLVATCHRVWRSTSAVPRIEDVVFRAIAMALADADENAGPAALVIAEPDSDVSSAFAAPGAMSLRDAVASRAAGGDAAFEDAEWTLVSLANLGVASAIPRLDPGKGLAFALSAPSEHALANLTMVYDSRRWSEGSAARLLVRIRELAETPYAMLV